MEVSVWRGWAPVAWVRRFSGWTVAALLIVALLSVPMLVVVYGRCCGATWRVKVLTPPAEAAGRSSRTPRPRIRRPDDLSHFHSRSQVCCTEFIASFVVCYLHGEGVQLLTWNMQHTAIQPQKDECCSETRSLVSIGEPLGTGESY
jgi:hypothetical protein